VQRHAAGAARVCPAPSKLQTQTRALALLACLVAGCPGIKADFCQYCGNELLWAALADKLSRKNTRVAEAILLECST